MKRRGTVSFSIGSLISILLVIIIFSILLVFHGKIISFLKNIFKSHRTIEQEVIDSTNGLVCALASVANGYELDERYCINGKALSDSLAYASKDGTKTAKFGDVRVTCNKEKQMCFVYNFYLPQKVDEDKPFSYIFNYGDPKYLIYYEMFPHGEERAWIQQGENDVLAIAAVSGVVGAFFSVGGHLSTQLKKAILSNKIRSSFALRLFWSEEDKALEKVLISKGISKDEASTLVNLVKNKEYKEFLSKATKEIGEADALKALKNYELTLTKKYLTPLDMELSDMFDELIEKGYVTRTEKGWVIKDSVKEKAVKEIIAPDIKNALEKVAGELKKMDKSTKGLWAKKARYYAKWMWNNRPTSLMLALEDATISKMTEATLKDYTAAEELEDLAKCATLTKGKSFKALCLLTFALGYTAARIDEMNEKYRNVGFNTLGIYSPLLFLGSPHSYFGKRFAISVSLPIELEPYMLVLDKCGDGKIGSDDIRFYLASPCKADLVITKKDVDIKVPVCYAWEKSWEEIKDEYIGKVGGDNRMIDKGNSRKVKKYIMFIRENCINRKNLNLDTFIDSSSIEKAEEFCACIPNDMLRGLGFSEEEISNRAIKYDEEKCNEFLEDPALFVKVYYLNDENCNRIKKDIINSNTIYTGSIIRDSFIYNKYYKYAFYTKDRLEKILRKEYKLLQGSNEDEFKIFFDTYCIKNNKDLNVWISLQEINDLRDILESIKSATLSRNNEEEFINYKIAKYLTKFDKCYPNYQFKFSKSSKIENYFFLYLNSYQLTLIQGRYKVTKQLKDKDELEKIFEFKEEKDKFTGDGDLISVLPPQGENSILNKIFGSVKHETIHTSVILIKVNKKEGFCYTPEENGFLTTIVVYAPFTAAEILADVVIGSRFGGYGYHVIHGGINFLTGFFSEIVNSYVESKAKWPRGEGTLSC